MTRLRAMYMAPGDLPSSLATSCTGLVSTAVRQKASQVSSANSQRTSRGGPAKEFATVFRADFCMVGFRVLLEACDLGRTSFTHIRAFTAEGVDDCVSGNAGEPCAETGPLRVGLPTIDRVGDGDQYGLGQILGIGVLHAAAPGHAVNHGAVHGNELLPGFAVGRILKL